MLLFGYFPDGRSNDTKGRIIPGYQEQRPGNAPSFALAVGALPRAMNPQVNEDRQGIGLREQTKTPGTGAASDSDPCSKSGPDPEVLFMLSCNRFVESMR